MLKFSEIFKIPHQEDFKSMGGEAISGHSGKNK